MNFVQKHSFFLVILCAHLAFSMQSHPIYTPENTQFAFDFHGVVVKPVTNRVSSVLLSREFITSIELNRYLPSLIYALATQVYRGGTGEQYIKLLQDYHQRKLAQLTLNIANNQRPIAETIVIIKELKDKGYEINMASDIGALVLKDFEEKESKKPLSDQVLPLFHAKHHVDYLANLKPVQKPNPFYFATYLQLYNSQHKPYIIFIDDKLKNVEGARKAGMIGIFFTTPAELKNKLVEMGIL